MTKTILDTITKLHQSSTQRIEIPGIMGDAPACTECGKAWPCPTVEKTRGMPLDLQYRTTDEIDHLFELARIAIGRGLTFYDRYSTYIREPHVEIKPDSNLITIAIYWNDEYSARFDEARAKINDEMERALSDLEVMPLLENAASLEEIYAAYREAEATMTSSMIALDDMAEIEEA